MPASLNILSRISRLVDTEKKMLAVANRRLNVILSLGILILVTSTTGITEAVAATTSRETVEPPSRAMESGATASDKADSTAITAFAKGGTVQTPVASPHLITSSSAQAHRMSLNTRTVSATEVHATLISPLSGGASVSLFAASPGTKRPSLSNSSEPASAAAATRLLEQTTFGPTEALIAHVQAVGLNRFLDEQLATQITPMPKLPNPLPGRCANFGALCNDENWWSNVITGNDQLRQRVAFALGEIFVISNNTVNENAFPPYVNGLASDAFTNWAKIMKDVARSPGMGMYLNALNSPKATGTTIANENFARENLQLFSIGTNLLNPDGTLQLDGNGHPIPAYTELQVQAFAKVFTGWTYAMANGAAPNSFPYWISNYNALMMPVDSGHDTTAKVLLNTTLPAGQTAQQDFDDGLKDIFDHPNVGPFVCKQLIQHLVTSNPTPQYVERVAAVFANDGKGFRGDMTAILKAILLDQEARAGDVTPAAADGHLREPILWITSVLRALSAVPRNGITDANAYYGMDQLAAGMGEDVFRPASVFSFYPPNYEVANTGLLGPEFALETTGTSMQKLTIADQIVNNRLPNLFVNLGTTTPLGVLATRSNTSLLDELDRLFLHGQMSPQMRTTLLNTLSPVSDTAQRVHLAVYLVISSGEYKVAH